MSRMAEVLASHKWLGERLDDEDLIVVDTRPKVAYSYGHIPNSVSLAVDEVIKISEHGAHLAPDAQTASDLLGSLGIDGSKTVVVAGDAMDPSGARVAWTLQYLGHENVRLLDIGMSAWQGMGLPLSRAQRKRTPAEFVPNVNHKIRIESDELKDNLKNFSILDARTPQEFFGGHIPGSVLVPFTDGLGQTGGLFETSEFLRKMFEEKQIPDGKDIVCYCMHGHRASSLFYQLRLAGIEGARLYDGSFIDWHSKRLGLE